jgi:class 3 adenylate cyclase
MFCPRCGLNADGAKVCSDCGSPLPWRCGACGSENPPGKGFCGDCGAAATDRAVAPQKVAAGTSLPERRHLTIMFADLVGSTALSARLDPEDLREVISSYHNCVTAVVGRFSGFVARYMGDGVLVYFGYPHAHEDDAERAIRAGLAIAEDVARLVTIAGPQGTLRTRVGIATGVAIVGDLIGSGASLESAVVGETPNLAARLQAVAEPGTVVVADATRRLAGGLFEYRDLGPVRLKGLDTPVRAWAVLSESVIDSRFAALRPGQMRLVGRTEEIELLLRRWEQAKIGEGRLVLLSGEPGIGKSRLVAALEQRVSDTPHALMRLLCSPHYQDTPLHPVIRHIERAVDMRRDDPPAAKLDKLRRSLSSGAQSEVDVGMLADLLSIPGSVENLLEARTPQHIREMTFAAIQRQFENLARTTPVLSVWEDIHWADPTTLDLLNFLIEPLERLPILLVVTARPTAHPFWATRSQVTVQFMNAFNRRDAASLIKEISGGRTLPEEVIERIVAHADGVPLFIEELTKTVLDTGLPGHGDAPLSRSKQLSIDTVPISLQALLMARLDALPSGKEIAQIGSVIGRDFSFDKLQTLSRLPAKRLEQMLSELVQAGVILPRGQPHDATYTFKHALVQDAAYATLLRDRRRTIHLRVAEALENEAAETEPQLLAWHFAEAGIPEKSVDYYLKAEEQTTGRFAFAEKVNLLQKGLKQLEHLPESLETQRRELTLQVALGRALIDSRGSGNEGVREAFERAHKLCLALGDTKQLVPVFDGLVLNYHFAHSEPTKMLSYAAELFELSQSTGDAQALVWARRSRSSANLLLGRFEEARHEMELVINMYKENHYGLEVQRMARDPRVSTSALLGICLTAMGYLDFGGDVSLQALRHAETINHVVSLNAGLRRICIQRMMQRNTHDVLKFSDRLLSLNAVHETFVGTREGTIFHGWAQLQARHDATLVHEVQTCLDQLEVAKHWVFLPFLMMSVAEVQGSYGDIEGALGLLDRASRLVKLSGEKWCESEIIRLQARFGAQTPAATASLLEAGLAKAREQGAKLWELRTAVSLAELWRDEGKRDAMRKVLAPVYVWFTEGFAAPDLVAARALLDDLRQPHG